ncbi:MAG: hypothetical protein ACOC0P_02450, partial [Planctomycetota bacterium]
MSTDAEISRSRSRSGIRIRFVAVVLAALMLVLHMEPLQTAAFAVAPPTAAEASGPEAAEADASDGVISFASAFFFSRGSMLGTAIIWFLLGLSVIGLGLIGYMWLNNRRSTIAPRPVLAEIRQRFERRDFRGLIDLVSNDRSHLSSILLAALRESPHGYPAMVRALES